MGVVEWLSEFARPVIITKHWHKATNEQLARLARCGTALNTSVSALDTDAELRHRMRQIERFRDLGGNSVARVVSCNFNQDSVQGAAMARVQEQLLALRPIVDNPLRCSQAHPLVVSGIIRVSKQRDLSEGALVSLARQDTYLGHCSACPDQCGLTGTTYTENPKQLSLLEE